MEIKNEIESNLTNICDYKDFELFGRRITIENCKIRRIITIPKYIENITIFNSILDAKIIANVKKISAINSKISISELVCQELYLKDISIDFIKINATMANLTNVKCEHLKLSPKCLLCAIKNSCIKN